MPGWTVRWLLNILAIFLTAAILPGFEVTVWGAVVGSVVLGVINAIIRPLLIILALPLNILTLGLFTFVINAIMLEITASTVKGFDIASFWWAIAAAVVLSIMSLLISLVVDDKPFKIF